jgi:hypothetical protein
VNEFVPVRVTELRHVHPEGREHVARVLRGHAALSQGIAQAQRFRLTVAAAEQFALQPVELRKLFVPRQGRVVGDIVGDADEFVERQDQPAMAGLDHEGRDRKVLVLVALAGPVFARSLHERLSSSGVEGLSGKLP